MGALVEIGVFPTRQEAEIVQARLASEGIDSVISADDAGGAYPFGLSGGARLLVDEADAQRANEIVG
jgi:hypothetical protein